MAGRSESIAVNGSELWAFVVELADGLRVRFSLDDWLRLNLSEGRRIPVRLPGREDVWLFVTAVTELPPIVWVTMEKRGGRGCEMGSDAGRSTAITAVANRAMIGPAG
jgi:hypothetical protein